MRKELQRVKKEEEAMKNCHWDKVRNIDNQTPSLPKYDLGIT